MKLHSLKEFLNESYSVDYLSVIIRKLKAEGKSAMDIFTYLDILNIPKERIMQSLSACGIHEGMLYEEGELDDLIDDVDTEAEEDKEETEKGEDEASADDKKKEEDDDDDDDEESSQDKKQNALKDVIDNVELLAKGVKQIKNIVNDKEEEKSEDDEI